MPQGSVPATFEPKMDPLVAKMVVEIIAAKIKVVIVVIFFIFLPFY